MNQNIQNGQPSSAFNPQTLRFAGVISLLFLFAVGQVFRPMSDWVYSQWLFSYQYGFVKRGLHGEILRWLGLDGSYPFIILLAIGILIVASVLLLRLFVVLLIGNRELKEGGKHLVSSPLVLSGWFFFLLALFHPATFRMLFYNLGRLEHMQLLFTLCCLLFMLHLKRSGTKSGTGLLYRRLGLFLAISGTIVISLLIHEAFYFFFLPVLFMAWFYTDPGDLFFNIIRLSLFIAASVLTWYISVYGLMDMDQYYPYMEAMRDQYGSRAVYSSLMVVFRDLTMNLDYTREWLLTTPRIPIFSFSFLILMSPGAILIWKVYKADIQYGLQFARNVLFKGFAVSNAHKKRLLRAGIFLSCLSPLCLIPIGFDLFRWFGLTFLNLFMMTSFLSEDREFRSHIISTTNRYWYLAALAIGFSLLMGALDVFISFSNEIYFKDWYDLIMNR